MNPKIAIWEGCDPHLASAVRKFADTWGPYSSTSRRYSIFRLVRELIDPEWLSLQSRYPGLTEARIHFVWKKYHFDRIFAREHDDEESLAQRAKRAEQEMAPCRGTIDGTYLPSELARRYGFLELESFFIAVRKVVGNGDASPHTACFDTLRELAVACRRKLPKVDRSGKLKARRAHPRAYCKACGQHTELAAHLKTLASQTEDSEDKLRLSAQYCKEHRPKAPFVDTIRPEYQSAKRKQTKFNAELSRLERQVRGQYSPLPSRSWAQSGNALVDDFFLRLVERHFAGADPEDPILRDFARDLVDKKVTDRKKEIVSLLAANRNQSEVASQLGVSRQLVSKALIKIPEKYRFDRGHNELR